MMCLLATRVCPFGKPWIGSPSTLGTAGGPAFLLPAGPGQPSVCRVGPWRRAPDGPPPTGVGGGSSPGTIPTGAAPAYRGCVRSLVPWRGTVLDVVVVALAAAAAVEVVLRDLGPRWVLLPAVILYTFPLMLRDRW